MSMDNPEVINSNMLTRRSGIRNAKVNRSASNPNFDSWSNSSLQSNSTQTSVYGPTYDPRSRVTSDWYDSRNDSDTSNGTSFVNRGVRINLRNTNPMAQIAENGSIGANLGANLTRSASSDRLTDTETGYGSSRGKPKTEMHVRSSTGQGYLSDAPSLSSTASSRMRAKTRLDSGVPAQNGFSNFAVKRSSAPSSPPFSSQDRASEISFEQFPASVYEEMQPTLAAPKAKADKNRLGVVLSFKERNFNFDFENNSLTSSLGVHEHEDPFGHPSRLVGDYYRPHPSQSMRAYGGHQPSHHQYEEHQPHWPSDFKHSTPPSQAPTQTTGLVADSTTINNEGYSSDLIHSSRRVPSKSGDTKEMEAFGDDTNSISMSSKAGKVRPNSSASSSNLNINKSPIDGSLNKQMSGSKASFSESSEQHTTISSDGNSSEGGGGGLQRPSIEKALRAESKGTFLLCIPRGVCMLEGDVRKVGFLNSHANSIVVDNKHTSTKDSVKKLWADLYQPSSFDAFLFHVQQAQFLRQLISQRNCPHILFHGPFGFGMKTLIMALLREIFGPIAWKVYPETREYNKPGDIKITTQGVASKCHVELDVESLGENARLVLRNLFKDITQSMEFSKVISNDGNSYETDFKVIVLHKVDMLPSDVQQLIRMLMDRYGDTCKLLLCSNDVNNVLDSIKSRCQLIGVDPPSQQEIVTVLQHIAEKEKIRVSLNFIVRIVADSNQNLRHAIESLEARKPILQGQVMREDLPIPTGWEDIVIELANDILMEQTPKKMFVARGKLQSLLKKHVPPHLILQSLVGELLKKLDLQLRKEICYWHALYEKRMTPTSNAINKLEEFVAKFMSIYKKNKKATL